MTQPKQLKSVRHCEKCQGFGVCPEVKGEIYGHDLHINNYIECNNCNGTGHVLEWEEEAQQDVQGENHEHCMCQPVGYKVVKRNDWEYKCCKCEHTNLNG